MYRYYEYLINLLYDTLPKPLSNYFKYFSKLLIWLYKLSLFIIVSTSY